MNQREVELVLAESSKAIDRQAAKLDTLRTQASGLISLGAVVVGLFVGLRGSDSEFSCLTWLGLAAFALVVVSGILILRPMAGWTFNQSARSLFNHAEKEAADDRKFSLARHLALDLERSYDKNDKRIDKLLLAYSLQLGSVLLVVAFLTIDAAVAQT